MLKIPDHDIRLAAVSDTTSNIVVTAGAGTGKTTLLVDRILHLLLREHDPITIGEIVALTFMNKAAQEIKLRLRERLRTFQQLDFDSPPPNVHQQRDWELLLLFQREYHLTKEHLEGVVSQTLAELEKSQIGTIHSFASHLLRLYPLESNISPDFQEDDGTIFLSFFQKEWRSWLEQELGCAGKHHEEWKLLLRMVDLSELQILARSLMGELNPLHPVMKDSGSGNESLPIRRWLGELASQAATLGQSNSRLTLHHMLKAAAQVFESSSKELDGYVVSQSDKDLINRKIPGITKDYSERDYALAKNLMAVARSLLTIPLQDTSFLLKLLTPFAEHCRKKFLQQGYVSFDGLLAKSRDLLRDHLDVRQELKRQYKAILVDEFQDTDPVQYEMIMYLGEEESGRELDWRTVRLATGKLFIVGDAKQSIYGFRRADMEAFDTIVQDKILGESPPGKSFTLQTNFRSHKKILEPLNAFFSVVFPAQPQRGIQPRYEPLIAWGQEKGSLPLEQLEIRLAQPSNQDPDVEEATRAEANELARWLKEEVLFQQEIVEQGTSVTIHPKHIAILLRTLTPARHYLDAFRKYQIPCIAEGEKHFYKRQEVIDTINLLRSAAHPYDQGALVAILRSSLGGIPDVTIETFLREKTLDHVGPGEIISSRQSAPYLEHIPPMLTLLRHLNQTLPLLPLPEMIQYVFEQVPLRELAAASLDQEQAMANLAKLQGIILELSRNPQQTFTGLVAELTKRVQTPPDESERSLSEEQEEENDAVGALRLLSIHKAKGLEFPVVILAGLHRKTNRQETRTFVSHDWGSAIFGFRVGDIQTRNGVFLQAKQQEREQAEQARILYVGMTRAKRRLILSGAITKRISSDSYLALLGRQLGFDPSSPESRSVDYGGTHIPLQVQTSRPSEAYSPSPMNHAWECLEEELIESRARWEKRKNRWKDVQATPQFSNPTALVAKKTRFPRGLVHEDLPHSKSKEQRRLTGTVAHRLLETWDFSLSHEHLEEWISRYCQKYVPEEGKHLQEDIQVDLILLFTEFVKTDVYKDLQGAKIVGREIPFSYLLHPGEVPDISYQVPLVLEGVIDILYKVEDVYWIGDYKTDDISEKEMAERIKTYLPQAEVYREAVRRSLLREDVQFQFIFLRNGKTVRV